MLELIKRILKQTILDLWEEMFYLFLFNMLTVVVSLLIIPLPFFLMALSALAYDIGEGKAIKFGDFFAHLKRWARPAVLWGITNLLFSIGLLAGLWLFSLIGGQVGFYLQLLLVGCGLYWLAIQLISMGLYPRLDTPTVRSALYNAAVLLGRYPAVMLVVFFVFSLIVLLSLIQPPLLVLITVAMTVMLFNATASVLVKDALQAVTPS